MTISVTYPYRFINGTIADANQVNADFDAINLDGFALCAQNGINSDITQLTGLTTPLSVDQGGTGSTTGALPPGVVMAYASQALPTGWLFCTGAAVSRTVYANLFAVIGTTYGNGDGSTTFNLPDLRARTIAMHDPGNSTGRMSGSHSGNVPGGAATFGNAGGEENHGLFSTEMPLHSHGVNDPQHTHGISQSPHDHAPPSINDPQHTHGATDGGHIHTISASNGPAGAGGILQTSTLGAEDSFHNTTTGYASITVAGAFTGITLSSNTGGAYANLSIDAASTGISTQNAGGTDAHNTVQPTLIMNWIIKT
jgi:microcystin-dependent protein